MDVILTRRGPGLARLPGNLRREIGTAVDQSGRRVLERAKSNIQSMGAVDTGRMLNSGVVEPVGPLARRIHFTAPYSLYVHEGHRTRGSTFVPGRPYLSTAVDQERGGIQQLIADAVRRAAR